MSNNIFVGFTDRKSCSRILKPPGGGTSDIFNIMPLPQKSNATKSENSIRETTETKSIDPKNIENGNIHNGANQQNGNKENDLQNENKSETNPENIKIESLSIIEENRETSSQNGHKTETSQETVQVKISSTSKTENVSSIIHQNEQAEVKPVIVEKKPAHQRVPPGGYSSGLW